MAKNLDRARLLALATMLENAQADAETMSRRHSTDPRAQLAYEVGAIGQVGKAVAAELKRMGVRS